MLARWVFTVWGAWLGALGLAAALTASGIWNTNPILPLGLSVLMFAAGLGLVIAATVRLIRGPRRDRALAGLLPDLLRPGGHALLEIGQGQESAVAPLFKGLELLRISPDLSGIPRCVILRKP